MAVEFNSFLFKYCTCSFEIMIPCFVFPVFPFYLSSIAFEGNIVQQHVGQDPLKALKVTEGVNHNTGPDFYLVLADLLDLISSSKYSTPATPV